MKLKQGIWVAALATISIISVFGCSGAAATEEQTKKDIDSINQGLEGVQPAPEDQAAGPLSKGPKGGAGGPPAGTTTGS
jgi:hypothetical protein